MSERGAEQQKVVVRKVIRELKGSHRSYEASPEDDARTIVERVFAALPEGAFKIERRSGST